MLSKKRKHKNKSIRKPRKKISIKKSNKFGRRKSTFKTNLSNKISDIVSKLFRQNTTSVPSEPIGGEPTSEPIGDEPSEPTSEPIGDGPTGGEPTGGEPTSEPSEPTGGEPIGDEPTSEPSEPIGGESSGSTNNWNPPKVALIIINPQNTFIASEDKQEAINKIISMISTYGSKITDIYIKTVVTTKDDIIYKQYWISNGKHPEIGSVITYKDFNTSKIKVKNAKNRKYASEYLKKYRSVIIRPEFALSGTVASHIYEPLNNELIKWSNTYNKKVNTSLDLKNHKNKSYDIVLLCGFFPFTNDLVDLATKLKNITKLNNTEFKILIDATVSADKSDISVLNKGTTNIFNDISWNNKKEINTYEINKKIKFFRQECSNSHYKPVLFENEIVPINPYITNESYIGSGPLKHIGPNYMIHLIIKKQTPDGPKYVLSKKNKSYPGFYIDHEPIKDQVLTNDFYNTVINDAYKLIFDKVDTGAQFKAKLNYTGPLSNPILGMSEQSKPLNLRNAWIETSIYMIDMDDNSKFNLSRAYYWG